MRIRARFGWRLPMFRNALVSVVYLNPAQIEGVTQAVQLIRATLGAKADALVWEVL
jgi:hypothetical protein